MSYKELFTRYGKPCDTAEIRMIDYLASLKSIVDLRDVRMYDRTAARLMDRCQTLIDQLTEYRKDLAARYGQLETMSYSDSLLLRRYRGDSVSFELTTIRTYEDGTGKTVSRENFSGKERHKAIARYNELKKQNPQMSASMDIEKRSWER